MNSRCVLTTIGTPIAFVDDDDPVSSPEWGQF